MAEMTRLRELAALFQPPKQPVTEAKTKSSDFEGIQNVVNDALEDLHDKLSEGGALESLADSVGMMKLDTQKDKEGFTILGRLDHLTAKYKKEVEKLMTEVELMFHSSLTEGVELTEMAAAGEFSSGWLKRNQARELVRAFRDGDETFDLKDGTKFKAVKSVLGSKLQKGMTVFASYDKYNQGANVYEIKGFVDEKTDKRYDSIQTAMKALGVSSFKALEDLNTADVRMIVKDLVDGDEGPFFYVFEGRWSYGSGGEPLSFTLVEKV